jgi:hypothetical protein
MPVRAAEIDSREQKTTPEKGREEGIQSTGAIWEGGGEEPKVGEAVGAYLGIH